MVPHASSDVRCALQFLTNLFHMWDTLWTYCPIKRCYVLSVVGWDTFTIHKDYFPLMGRSAKNHLQMANPCFGVLIHRPIAQIGTLVWMVGSAPTTSCSQNRRSTKLNYTQILINCGQGFAPYMWLSYSHDMCTSYSSIGEDCLRLPIPPPQLFYYGYGGKT